MKELVAVEYVQSVSDDISDDMIRHLRYIGLGGDGVCFGRKNAYGMLSALSRGITGIDVANNQYLSQRQELMFLCVGICICRLEQGGMKVELYGRSIIGSKPFRPSAARSLVHKKRNRAPFKDFFPRCHD